MPEFRPVGELSADEARRLAVVSQGLGGARRDPSIDGRSLRRTLRRVGLFQMDSVSALVRAHYLPLFSRIGPYPRDLLDSAAYRSPRRLFEYWGHQASLIPVEMHPLFRWRMESLDPHTSRAIKRLTKNQPGLVNEALGQLRDRGPLTAAELSLGEKRATGPWWDRSDSKTVLESLFWTGEVACADRRGFTRVYDLADRVIPRSVIGAPTPTPAEAQRQLLLIASRACGVAAEQDLRGYFQLPLSARRHIAELVEAGELLPIAVEGWGSAGAFIASGTKVPDPVDPERGALIGPFDSLLWGRERLQRIFNFEFKIELYVPPAKRRYGYYVLPFLFGDRLVGRVDLKAVRSESSLEVRAIHLEEHPPAGTPERIRDELSLMAEWLGLERVVSPGS